LRAEPEKFKSTTDYTDFTAEAWRHGPEANGLQNEYCGGKDEKKVTER
jgi:hypothetical protein